METVEAIFEHGVFRPINPVAIPENSRVQLHIVKDVPVSLDSDDGMDEIYDILDKRFSSGYTDTAERHNEHQP